MQRSQNSWKSSKAIDTKKKQPTKPDLGD